MSTGPPTPPAGGETTPGEVDGRSRRGRRVRIGSRAAPSLTGSAVAAAGVGAVSTDMPKRGRDADRGEIERSAPCRGRTTQVQEDQVEDRHRAQVEGEPPDRTDRQPVEDDAPISEANVGLDDRAQASRRPGRQPRVWSHPSAPVPSWLRSRRPPSPRSHRSTDQPTTPDSVTVAPQEAMMTYNADAATTRPPTATRASRR